MNYTCIETPPQAVFTKIRPLSKVPARHAPYPQRTPCTCNPELFLCKACETWELSQGTTPGLMAKLRRGGFRRE